MTAPTASGIYIIQRKDSDECYIGSAVDIAQRWRVHRRDLCKGSHHSLRLQRVHDKHGMASLEFVVLETVAEKTRLIEREQVWLDRFRPAYNTYAVAGSSLGHKQSPEHSAAISRALKGRKQAPEHIAASTAANTGRKYTPEQNAANSARQKGIKQTPEHVANAARARTGKKHTPGRIAAQVAGMAAARARLSAVGLAP